MKWISAWVKYDEGWGESHLWGESKYPQRWGNISPQLQKIVQGVPFFKTSLLKQTVEGDLTKRAIPKDEETFTTAVTDFARRAIPKDEEKQ
jgi:hypothetical protein